MCGASAFFMKKCGMLPDSKTLNDYAERCMTRPAYQKPAAMSARRGLKLNF